MSSINQVAITLENRVGKVPVDNEAAVKIDELIFAVAPRPVGTANIAFQHHFVQHLIHEYQSLVKFWAKEPGNAIVLGSGGQVVQLFAVMEHSKMNIGMRQKKTLEPLQNVIKFGAVCA